MENPLSKYVLFVGIAAAILKGGEVLLRKHQKEWVQTGFNNLSKWFDSKKPLAYVKTERGRNAILWWGFVVYWDGRLVSYGIKNNYRILTIIGVVIFLGWLVIFRYVTVMFFELIRVETPKFRLGILTGLRERVHNFFLRWYQISIAWIILSEKSGVYIIRSFVYGLALTLVSLFLVFSVFIYLIVVMFTVLAAIDGTVPTNPLLLTGMAVSLFCRGSIQDQGDCSPRTVGGRVVRGFTQRVRCVRSLSVCLNHTGTAKLGNNPLRRRMISMMRIAIGERKSLNVSCKCARNSSRDILSNSIR
ncbi:MAG: hypothetical protein QOF62_313 [Pyrinomonadaceae bacterium]|nr:hypothetical protein [Pyrinomonadaceae bacterium]